MTDAEMMAEIQRVIQANADALGEPVEVRAIRQTWGGVRVYAIDKRGRVVRHSYREYSTVARAYDAALTAESRGRAARELVLDGVPVRDAVRRVTTDYYR